MQGSEDKLFEFLANPGSYLVYGPIGLAALMSVLAMLFLLFGDFSKSKRPAFYVFLGTNVVMFVASLLASRLAPSPDGRQYNMDLSVYPADLASNPSSIQPTVKINGEKRAYPVVNFPISSNISLSVDVSAVVTKVAELDKALDGQKMLAKSALAFSAEQAKTVNGAILSAKHSQSALVALKALTIQPNCKDSPGVTCVEWPAVQEASQQADAKIAATVKSLSEISKAYDLQALEKGSSVVTP
ncbi:MAG: hypothetical protein P4L82_19900 [Ancalomicrobiaceae bacterium]|nr:hypothetical protein [Ancalomicrobiaceae bacterium]